MKRRRIKSTVKENEESMEKKNKSQSEVVTKTEKNMARIMHREKFNMARIDVSRKKFKFNCLLDLPLDILEMIMKRLFYIDLINFRVVCKSLNLIKMRMTPSLVQQHPWLVIFDETTISIVPSLVNRTSCSCQLFDPTYEKTYTIDMSRIHNLRIQRVYESKYGWLLISPPNSSNNYDYMLFAFTPFSSVNNFIELPTFDESRIVIHFATFTSNPSMDQDCLFIVIHNHHQFNKTPTYNSTFGISTCRCGDKLWSTRYLKYSGPVPFWASFTRGNIFVNEIGHWIYSEGNIYYMVLSKMCNIGTPRSIMYHERLINRAVVNDPQHTTRVPNVKLLEPNRIVKWPEVVKSHGTDGELLYGSVMKLDDEDHDDSKYWVSKLRKEFRDLIYVCPYTSDCDYGTWDDMKGRCKILKIDPPPHQ